MIDPKRLTEKDKGRRVRFPRPIEGGGYTEEMLAGFIKDWDASWKEGGRDGIVLVVCDCHGITCFPPNRDLFFEHGIYQDGGLA